MNPYIVALISVLSAVIGASLQFWFSRRTTDWSRLQEKRVQAYVDFLKASVGLGKARADKDKESEQYFWILFLDAKARTPVYGHPEVVAALAAFSRTDQILVSEATRQSWGNLIHTMRLVSKAGEVRDDELYSILYGSQPRPETSDSATKTDLNG